MNKTYKIDKDSVKRLAHNRWFELFNALIPEQGDIWAKGARRQGKSYTSTPCPLCGGVDRFGFLPDGNETGAAYCRTCGAFPDGLDLIRKYKRCSFYQVLSEVSGYLQGEPVARVIINHADKRPTPSNKWAAIDRIIAGCGAPTESHLEYWSGRGLKPVLNNPSVLYSKGIAYYVDGKPLMSGDKWLTYPAIIGRMSNARGWCGIQQVYLTKDGSKAGAAISQELKARGIEARASSKRMLGEVTGGAVRLGKAGRVLAVCEGLETAVSIAQASNFWAIAACGTAANLINVDIPESVEHLIIFADKDASGAGERAAHELYEREQQVRRCEIALPTCTIPRGAKGIDWLDCLALDSSNIAETLTNIIGRVLCKKL